jgi:hypothetical protein
MNDSKKLSATTLLDEFWSLVTNENTEYKQHYKERLDLLSAEIKDRLQTLEDTQKQQHAKTIDSLAATVSAVIYRLLAVHHGRELTVSQVEKLAKVLSNYFKELDHEEPVK